MSAIAASAAAAAVPHTASPRRRPAAHAQGRARTLATPPLASLLSSRSSSLGSSSRRCVAPRGRLTRRLATTAAAAAGEASSTWPDGSFRGSWKTMECPPNPRPDIYAAPKFHGTVADAPGARVQVRVYMIDRFGLSRVGRMVLRKEFDAIWHVGVVVHGREYNFADKVAFMNIGGEDIESQSMHGFAPSYVYEVGNTTKTQEELDAFVFGTLSQKFCIENYCSFTNNCHNFSDDVTQFLVGKAPAEGGFPQWCLDHGGAALSNLPNADAETIRLASNKIAKVMMVSFGKFNRERMKILKGKEWENPLEEGKKEGEKGAKTQPNASQ